MMKAVITNNKGDYFYIKENVELVTYGSNSITLAIRENKNLTYLTYSANEVIINIFASKDE